MDGYTGFDVAEAQTKEELQKEHRAAQLWQEVVVSVNECLEAHESLGYYKFPLKADPSIADIELSINAIEGALNGMLTFQGNSFKAWNDISNCLQSIHLIRRLFIALKNKDQAEYEDCIRKLQSQRQ